MKEPFRPLAVKFTALFLFFAIAVCSVVSFFTYRAYMRSMLERYGEHGAGVARIAASRLDAEQILAYASSGEPDEAYFETLDELFRVKENGGVTYLYVQMPVSDDLFMYIFDADYYTLEEHGAETALGMLDVYEGAGTSALAVMETGMPAVDLEITRTVYGYLASAYAPILNGEGHPVAYVGVDLSMNEIYSNLHAHILRLALVTLAVVVAGFVLLLGMVRRAVVRPLETISRAASEFTENIAQENCCHIDIHSHDELGVLARSVNQLFDDIRSYTARLAEETARRERIQQDLETARHIQQEVLPRSFPPDPACPYASIYASMQPAKWVGGDFYDFFRLDADRIAVVIGDVSGKGIPAALFMMIVRTMIKNQALTGAPLDRVFQAVNDQLCQDNDAGMFVTAFLAVYDRRDTTLRCVNAGHNPPLLLRRDGTVHVLEVTPNFVLGGMEDLCFSVQEYHLDPGDSLLLYTDGVTEATDCRDALYGDARLQQAAYDHRLHRLDPKGAEQADDVTLLLLRILD